MNFRFFFILVISFGIDFIFSLEHLLFINIILLVLFIFCLNFFRDPKRIVPKDENCIVSPADGKIIKIKEFDHNHILMVNGKLENSEFKFEDKNKIKIKSYNDSNFSLNNNGALTKSRTWNLTLPWLCYAI